MNIKRRGCKTVSESGCVMLGVHSCVSCVRTRRDVTPFQHSANKATATSGTLALCPHLADKQIVYQRVLNIVRKHPHFDYLHLLRNPFLSVINIARFGLHITYACNVNDPYLRGPVSLFWVI